MRWSTRGAWYSTKPAMKGATCRYACSKVYYLIYAFRNIRPRSCPAVSKQQI